MKIILALILFFSSVVLADPFKLTKKDIKTIHKSYDTNKIVVRYKRFSKFIKEAKKFNENKKLIRVNNFINKIRPEHDSKAQNVTDHWSTPKEFLINGRGDCEDYAITKYFTLLKIDVKKEKLYFAIVQVKGRPTLHMVLLYFKTPKSIPLVIDNLSWKVLPLNKRKDLEVKVIFNEIDSHIMKNNYLGQKTIINWGKINKWEDILKRIDQKN